MKRSLQFNDILPKTKIACIAILCLFSFTSNAEVRSFKFLKKRYGAFLGSPAITEDGEKAFLTFRKYVDGVPKYTLTLIENDSISRITNFPTIPEPYDFPKDNKWKSGETQLEYFGVCTLFKGEIIIGLGKPRSDYRTEPEKHQEFLYKYKDGVFTEFMFSDYHMNMMRFEELGDEKKYRSKKSFTSFESIVSSTDDYIIFSCFSNGNDACHYFDGNEFTFLYENNDTYSVQEPIDKTSNYTKTVYYPENDFIVVRDLGNEIVSYVQQSKIIPQNQSTQYTSDGQKSQHEQQHRWHAIYVFNKETKKSVYYTDKHIDFLKCKSQKEAEMALRVVRGKLYLRALLTKKERIPMNRFGESYKNKYSYVLYEWNNGKWEIPKLDLVGATDNFEGIYAMMGQVGDVQIMAVKDNFKDFGYYIAPYDKKSGNKNISMSAPLESLGMIYRLVPESSPIYIGKKPILHYKSNGYIADDNNSRVMDVHCLYDGKKFWLYTGFQTYEKGKANKEGYPAEMFKVKNKYFLRAGSDSDELYVWEHNPEDIKEMR